MKKTNDDQMYFVEAAGTSATQIGRKNIDPNAPPKGYTEKEYLACRKQIEHYVEAGVVLLHAMGTSEAAQAARDVKAEHKRLSEIVAGGKTPPAPKQINIGFPDPEPVPEPDADTIPTFSTGEEEDEPEDDRICIALTSRGVRCKRKTKGVLLVCDSHLTMLRKNKKLVDTIGNRIAKDGKSVKT